jgi:hypothetical protein
MLEPCNAHTLPHIDTHPRQAAPARGGYPRYALSPIGGVTDGDARRVWRSPAVTRNHPCDMARMRFADARDGEYPNSCAPARVG